MTCCEKQNLTNSYLLVNNQLKSINGINYSCAHNLVQAQAAVARPHHRRRLDPRRHPHPHHPALPPPPQPRRDDAGRAADSAGVAAAASAVGGLLNCRAGSARETMIAMRAKLWHVQ